MWCRSPTLRNVSQTSEIDPSDGAVGGFGLVLCCYSLGVTRGLWSAGDEFRLSRMFRDLSPLGGSTSTLCDVAVRLCVCVFVFRLQVCKSCN